MSIDLYLSKYSHLAMIIRVLAKKLGVELKLHYLDLMKGEQLSPEFVKLNPQHCIPTIVDDGFSLWESRAILIYLIQKYAKDNLFYPECPKTRAVINQRLYFDLGTLNARFGEYIYPILREKLPADPETLKKLHEALGLLNTFLEGQKFVAGDSLTIADYPIFANVLSISYCKIGIEQYSNIIRWLEEAKKLIGNEDLIQEHREAVKEFFNTIS